MTRLADVYEGDVGRLQSRRRVQLGLALLVVGAMLALVSILIATTDLFIGDAYGARRVAGLLGGLGTSAILGGVVTVLPANPKLRVAAGIGASISLLGIAMFWHAYPDHWAGHGNQLTPYVIGVYFLGTLTLVSCLFAGIVTLKRRNDPGGMISMEFTTETRTEPEVVTVERPMGPGGVGRLGGTPDGDVETQTNRPGHAGDRREDETRRHRSRRRKTVGADRGANDRRSPASDGGIVSDDLQSPDSRRPGVGVDDRRPSDESGTLADRYCGNCQQFKYVRTSDGMQPYCSYHDRTMDDMDACEEWTSNG